MARKEYFTKTISLPGGGRKYVYGKTKEEVEEKYLQAKLMLRAGIELNDDTTVGEFALMWIKVYKEPKLKRKSLESILNALNNHILPYMSAVKLKSVTPMLITNCLNHLSDKSHSLYRTVLQVIREIFDTAVDNNLIVKSPVPKKQKAEGTPAVEKEPLSVEQEKLLLKALAGTRAHLLVWFLDATGLRRGEALGLMWDCVDLRDINKASVHVRRNLVYTKGKAYLEDTPKTDKSIRTVPLPPDLAAALVAARSKSNSMFVFHMKNGKMLSESSFRSLWRAIDARQKPEKDPDPDTPNKHPNVLKILDFYVTPHQLRHTYATRCFENGMDVTEVQKLLGHASPDITMRIYIHFCEKQRAAETFQKAREVRSYIQNSECGTNVVQIDPKMRLASTL